MCALAEEGGRALFGRAALALRRESLAVETRRFDDGGDLTMVVAVLRGELRGWLRSRGVLNRDVREDNTRVLANVSTLGEDFNSFDGESPPTRDPI